MFLVVFALFCIFHSVHSTQCMLCDTFQGYCELEGSTCIGSLCASRIATLDQGLIRVQKLCVPTDTPLGCRGTMLWRGLQGRECVCSGHMCNSSKEYFVRDLIFILFALLLI